MTPAWQRRRGRFNHDWLKNRFLLAVGGFLNLLDGLIEDSNLEQTFVTQVLPEWRQHQSDLFALISEFEWGMSPARTFDRLPLARCDSWTREWLGRLVHALWLARCPVRRWTSECLANALEADAAFLHLQAELSKCPNVRSARVMLNCRPAIVAFQRACQSLARAIEQFPSELRAV